MPYQLTRVKEKKKVRAEEGMEIRRKRLIQSNLMITEIFFFLLQGSI